MQNVVFTNRRVLELSGKGPARAACLNELSGLLYVLDEANLVTVVQTNTAALHVVRSFRVEDVSKAQVVSMSYLVEGESLCLVTSDGSIAKVHQNGTCEEMASNEEGIDCAAWSPSQEHLVLTTKNHSLIELNGEFDLVNETPLDDAGEQGQAVRSNISWKADGKFFTVNYQVGEGRKCLTRDVALIVFKSPSKSDPDEKGLVQSVSDAPVKMGELCAWQPLAGLIAGYDRKGPKDSFRVIFWEKNGLRHLEFEMPAFVEAVNALTWSIDSELLYVEVQSVVGRKLLVYHRANYHWYLKSTLTIDAGDLYLVHKQRRNRLLVVSGAGVEELQLSLQFSPHEWTSLEREQKLKRSLQFCVDGDILHLSDFSKGVIPPPMSHFQVKVDQPINAAAILGAEILILTDSTVQLYDYTQKKVVNVLPNKLQCKRYWQVRLLSTKPALVFSVGNNVYTNGERSKAATFPAENSTQIGDISILAELDHNRLTVNGRVLSEECTSYCLYDRFLLFTCNSTGMYQKLFVFNLNLNLNRWVWDGQCEDPMKQLPTDDSKSLSLRMVQRGSRIVCCSDGRVIFQLPRGNLQTVFPKVVTLHRVKDCVQQQDYLMAFELARTHKLDLNLLFDINPQQFVEQCEHALRSINKTDYINLFVASLKEEVSQELKYCLPSNQVDAIREYLATIDSKVKLICERASATLRSIDKEKYILSIYTCEVKRGDLAGVLREIKESRQHDKVQQKVPPHLQADKPKRTIGSREVLQYVCWLADPQVIYKVALLTYDLQLVAMAAEFTQKDPKEYVPYLEELRAITNQVDRRTRICLDLKKYDEAVEELAKGNQQQVKRAMALVKEHHLFNKGVIVFRETPNNLLEVKRLMAEYLLSKEEINEAITILESSRMLEKALEIATTHFKVKKMIELMDALNVPRAEQRTRLQELLPKMLENGAEAKELSRAYENISEYELAIKNYIKHGYFQRASTLLKHLSPSFQHQLQEVSKLAFSLQYNDILKTRRTYQEKHARLMIVQKEKRDAPVLQIATKEADEMYSEYSSSHISQSNYTVSTTTGMKKKKQKVKGILNRNVKEGSPLEEDYLVALLSETAEKFQTTLKQTKQLIQFLIHANLLEEAQQLRNEARQTSLLVSKRVRPVKEVRYEEQHEEVLSIYPPYQPKTADNVASFDWLL